jgi:hypothetical protein
MGQMHSICTVPTTIIPNIRVDSVAAVSVLRGVAVQVKEFYSNILYLEITLLPSGQFCFISHRHTLYRFKG